MRQLIITSSQVGEIAEGRRASPPRLFSLVKGAFPRAGASLRARPNIEAACLGDKRGRAFDLHRSRRSLRRRPVARLKRTRTGVVVDSLDVPRQKRSSRAPGGASCSGSRGRGHYSRREGRRGRAQARSNRGRVGPMLRGAAQPSPRGATRHWCGRFVRPKDLARSARVPANH